jgi:hypothetical protein
MRQKMGFYPPQPGKLLYFRNYKIDKALKFLKHACRDQNRERFNEGEFL